MADKTYNLRLSLSDGSLIDAGNFVAPQGEAGKTAYEYAQDGGYTGTETEFAEKMADDGITPLVGTTETVTPTQVKEAVLAGRPILLTYNSSDFGEMTLTTWDYSVYGNFLITSSVAYFNMQFNVIGLWGIIEDNSWVEMPRTIIPTRLSELTDDATHRTVSDTEKEKWNASRDFFINLTPVDESTATSDKSLIDIARAIENGKTPYALLNGFVHRLVSTDGGDMVFSLTVMKGSFCYTSMIIIHTNNTVEYMVYEGNLSSFSGSYNDLTDKPKVLTEANVNSLIDAKLSTLDASEVEY